MILLLVASNRIGSTNRWGVGLNDETNDGMNRSIALFPVASIDDDALALVEARSYRNARAIVIDYRWL